METTRKILCFVALLAICHIESIASTTEAMVDTLRVNELAEVVVRGVRLSEDAPFAVYDIEAKTLTRFQQEARELPTLLSSLPGVLSWSDNGLGIGTTYLRIRGSGDSRINVTLDGVALNSPEDQCVFWANTNSFASFLGSVQLQKGVGSSTNGDGAFGGNIALVSERPKMEPSGSATLSYGMYNTLSAGVNLSSGLLHDHWAVDAAYHHSMTDGYLHGTAGRGGSAYLGLAWMDDHVMVRYRNVFNYERMGQAWNGVDTEFPSYRDAYQAGLGRYNNLYESLVVGDDGTYTTSRYEMRDGSLWSQTTDNFLQDHNLLSLSLNINQRLQASATLHYTYGYGYYRELKPDTKLSKFGLSDFPLSDGETLTRTDFVRKKGLRQHTYGAVVNLNYQTTVWDVVGGLSVQQFSGNHFGRLTYVRNIELWDALGGTDYPYYDSDAEKTDVNLFARATYKFPFGLSLYADMQERHVRYKTTGVNDKFIKTGNGYENQVLDINELYDFFNPKLGLSYRQRSHKVFASLAVSHREPERNNFTDNGSYPAPSAERLFDWEVGYAYNDETFRADLTLYYMKYKNQFVQTGELSDIGEALTTNIPSSYRMGMELSLGVTPLSWLDLSGNIALSRNRLKDFNEVVEDWDLGTRTIHYEHSTLAFSPSLVANLFVRVREKGWSASWQTQVVSRQYLDNTASRARSLPSYSVSNVNVSYDFKVKKLKGLSLSLYVNNIFNHHYAASGWVYSAICESEGYTEDHRYQEMGFFPMAGISIVGSINVSF